MAPLNLSRNSVPADGAIVMQILTVEELSVLIRKAPQTIYNDLCRNPRSLPPIVNIPGSRRILFVNVDEWLASHIKTHQSPQFETSTKLGRGRPTKLEQIARNNKKA